MSSPGPPPGRGDKKERKSGKKKGSGKKKTSKKKTKDSDDESRRSKKDGSTTDEGASGSGAKDDEEGGAERTGPKPKSAGQTVRDAAQRVLNLAVKGEWTAVEGVLKSIEKAVALAGEEAHLAPMAGVLDPVSTFHFHILI